MFSGVLLPTHAASIQCVLGKARFVRLNLVRPPVPVSIGRSSAFKRLKSAHLAALTAAASFNGALAWALIGEKSTPRNLEYSSSDMAPFSSLCFRQAQTRLLTRFDPPRARDLRWSTFKTSSHGLPGPA